MSFSRANIPTDSPSIAGLDASDTSSNQTSVPVPWWIGPDRRPLTWIVPEVYNRESVKVTQDGGKAGEITTGYKEYVDVAGIAGLGLLRRIRYIESGNTRVWEGNITRPDDPAHPDYWEVKISTTVGDFYITWGRVNQPEDTHLLGPLGAKDPSLKHPAYGRQIRVVIIRYYCGQGATTVPNTVLGLDREPSPAIGNFPAQGSDQGESMVAGELELMTDPVFGAGLDAKYFTAADWEALSTAVIARVGCHAPTLDRARPLRDVIKDFQGYYDGWKRLQNGQIKPGWFPHDGTVPDGITELSVHDFVAQPKVRATTPSAAINEVVVTFRDVTDYLKKKPSSESASDNARARKVHDSRPVEMLGIVTLEQAQAFAAEAAATGAEGEWEAEVAPVRRSRLKWADGTPLRAGDIVNIDLIAPQVDQVSRVTKRVDFFRGPPQIDFIAERGVYPTPYVPPASLRPDIGAPAPLEITHARILELTPALYGSNVGLPIAAIAMRPQAAFSGLPALTTKDVIGFNFWHSPTGSSYDSLGRVGTWAVRATLRTALPASSADVTVQLALDAANLDLARIAPQSAEAQKNNELLIVIGNELFSAGSMSIDALNYDVACNRARLGSLAAAHGVGDECWLVFRKEITPFVHGGFVEDTDRWFKLQPFTRGNRVLALSDADPLVYHFRDRAPEKPVVSIDPLPVALVAAVTYTVTGQISDVNGDLDRYVIEAVLLTGPGGTIDSKVALAAGDFEPEDKALFDFRTRVTFAAAGTWRIVVRAYDETGKYTRVQTGELTVGNNTGGYGRDDGVTPAGPTVVTVESAIEGAVIRWTPSHNTKLLRTLIYESATAVMPELWLHPVDAPQAFWIRGDLPEGATRYYWLVEEGVNGRLSAPVGPFAVTIVVWPRVGTLESSLAAETAERNADVVALNAAIDGQADTLNAAIDAEEAARGDADAVLADRATALESTVDNPTSGVAATKARVDTIESTYASQAYADARKAEAIVAAAADATTKVSSEATARAAADTTLGSRATALESTVNDPTSGLAVTKARVDTIESTYASQAYADARKAEAIVAAAADATSKVSDEATARASADTTLGSRATALESTVNDPTSGVAATKARVDTVYSTFATTAYADARKAEAIAAAASDAQARVDIESAVRAGQTGSLASEVVLKTTTSGGGVTRVAGFRLTNLGGAGGSSDFLLQADKIALTNSTGSNVKSPFVIVGGVVYIDTTLIRLATITRAMILSLDVDTGDIQDLAVTTLKVAGNAITAEVAVSGSNTSVGVGATVQIVSASITTTGGRIRIIFGFTLAFNSGGSVVAGVYRNGSAVSGGTRHMTMPWSNNDSRSFIVRDTPGAGTYTYAIKLVNPNDAVDVSDIVMAIEETKK